MEAAQTDEVFDLRYLEDLSIAEGINFAAPCSATPDTDCWLLDDMPTVNRLIYDHGCHLFEQDNAVVLSVLQGATQKSSQDKPHECTLLVWLVRSHRCIEEYVFHSASEIVLNALKYTTHVKKLEMKFNDDISVLAGQSLLNTIQAAEAIEEVRFSFKKLHDNVTAQELGHALAQKSMLKCLAFEGVNDLKLLASFCKHFTFNIHTLVLSKSRLSLMPFRGLIRGIRAGSVVSSLDVSSCSLDNTHARLIANLMKTNTTIKSLSLAHNRDITWVGLFKLVSTLEVNTTLANLNLSYTRTGKRVAQRLAKSLQCNETLHCIDLSYCMYLNMNSVDLIITTARSLKRLGIRDVLKDYLSRARTLANALSQNTWGTIVDIGSISWCAVLVPLKECVVQHRIECTAFFTTDLRMHAERERMLGTVISNIKEICLPDWISYRRYRSLSYIQGSLSNNIESAVSLTRLDNVCLDEIDIDIPILNYIGSTTTLERVSFLFSSLTQDSTEALCDALQQNVSIVHLTFKQFHSYDQDVLTKENLETLIMISIQQDRLESLTVESKLLESVMARTSLALACNYSLTAATFNGAQAGSIRSTVLRNRQLQHQALQFLLHDTTKKRWAQAFEVMHDVGAVRRRAAQLAGSSDEVERLVRSKTFFLRQNYFVITCVVKRQIRCHEAGRAQIDSLDAPCICMIASYLSVSDVKNTLQ
ncbi:uncharacterized protein LOC135399624 [Ornithodoros turicata]|uniref:uncharacterized protein LOC135399624 n=1 Tax=Ornithodoros turicata TaxID=34597 RepID=UPI003139649A